jgi:hypothetical protein
MLNLPLVKRPWVFGVVCEDVPPTALKPVRAIVVLVVKPLVLLRPRDGSASR